MVKEIITRVVVDIASGRVLEKKSFEYRGKIAECKGGGQQTSTSTTELPAWLKPYAQQFIDQYQSQAFDENGNVINQPADLNQQLAGLNSIQDAALQNMVGQSGDLQRYSSIGLNQSANTLSGQYLNPDTNPYLGATYDIAARKLTDAYSTATAPSIMAAAQRGGNFGGSAMDQAMAMSRYDLGENLADQGTKIYGGNYANERSNQLNTLAQMPSTLNAAYTPQQALYGAGAQYQQQQQGQYDTDYSNALNRTQFPFEVLSGFGGALGQASMGAGSSTTRAGGSGGGGMMGSKICSLFRELGRMDDETWAADTKFGASLDRQVLEGYWLFATPLVRVMRRWPILVEIAAPVVDAWAYEMKKQVTRKGKGSFCGRLILQFGIPLCRLIGTTRAAVIRLRSMSHPSAVFRSVVSLIVNTLKLQPRRALTHIGKEIFKRMKPTLAYRDTSPSVIVVADIFGIGASRLHLSPGSIRLRWPMVRSVPMRKAVLVEPTPFRISIAPQTPAALSVPRTNALAIVDDGFSTEAAAEPSGLALAAGSDARNDGQSAKREPGHIFQIMNFHEPHYATGNRKT